MGHHGSRSHTTSRLHTGLLATGAGNEFQTGARDFLPGLRLFQARGSRVFILLGLPFAVDLAARVSQPVSVWSIFRKIPLW
jgi:hypothetical protein